MFLKRLDLSGFKSFAPHTTTELQPGIVVVVGPNGSGKSNIADSVRWVLGEQSAKAVRARKPEEVIFAGSATRQPLGMAEASLVLDNADGSLPIEYSDVRVTRRLYRSGESEYLLNGAKVRLKDITQLLLHAGLSPDSYTVIGQGSIDELILQRPEERRIAFESAADIRRHQLRLNETHSRLSTTETNLTRVQDVIAELAPHVRRLKSQAERAARADAFRAELHDLLLRYFRLRLARARAERDGADQQLQLATQAAERAETQTSASEQVLSQFDTALAALDEQLAVLRPRAASYREQAAATERALAVTRERAAGTLERRAALNGEVERQSHQLQRLFAEQAAHAAEPAVESPAGSEQDVALARTRLRELQHSLTGARAERQQGAAAHEAALRRVHDLETRLAELERELHTVEAAQAVEQARAADRAPRLQTLGEELERLQREETALRDEAQRANSQREAASERYATASEAERAATETLREASQHADRLHGAYAALGIPAPEDSESAQMPDRWRDLLTDLPVVGLAGELAARIRPIDRLLHAYLRRIVVLRDDPGAREAHRRLAAALGDQEAAWAVLSLDGLLLTPGGETPLEPADEAASGLADWRRQVRELEQQLQQAEATRAAATQAHSKATEERQLASEADQAVREASNIATTELEQRLRSRRIVESELQELWVEQQRGAAVLEERSAERKELAVRLDALSAELSQAREERERAHEAAQEHEQLLAKLQQQLSQAQANMLALEATQSKRQVERAAQQALRERIDAEIGTTRESLAAAHQQLEQLDRQANELGERETQLIQELQATLLALAPIEEELSKAELQRTELQTSRRTEETHLAELRTTERLAREDREEHHVQAQRTADDLERL
ncbi:MAG TPA: AAA family ATPase, partial [Chloroflexota bacterium]|nr:AAA family ATPase [Chloroflexota bacterium]